MGERRNVDLPDLELRNITYRLFAELGRAPTAGEVAGVAGAPLTQVRAGWSRLHDQHALVLDPATGEIRMASPFSAVAADHRVRVGGRLWYANCAWDAFGICAALDADGSIETRCPDCGDPIALRVRGRRSDHEGPLFHCLVPAAGWWDDIVFT